MSKRKLLLADDSVTIQKVVNLTFADEGFEVFTAGSGTAAMNMIPMIKPDLVLADVHMPGLTGYEVCEKIRQKSEFAELPVVLLVGSFEPFDETEAVRVGANDYLTKPFQSIRQLVQKVAQLIESPTRNLGGGAIAVEEANRVEASETANVAEDSAAIESAVSENEQNAALAQPIGDLGDAGMDDQMIETMAGYDLPDEQADNKTSDQTNAFVAVGVDDAAAEIGETDQSNQFEDSFHNRPTAPLSLAEIETVATAESSNEIPTETIEAETIEAEIFAAETIEAEPLDADSSQMETADFELETAMPQNDIFPEIEETPFGEMPPQPLAFDAANSANDNGSHDFEMIAEPDDQQTVNFFADNSTAQTNAAASPAPSSAFADFDFDLDDDSLLDLGDDEPEIAAEPIAQTETESSAPPAAVEVLPAATGEFNQTSGSSALQQIGTQAVSMANLQFPPEIIDAIAQKVVEKLSDKVIEKIAWEVVPDRFDLIVRKHINGRER